MPLGARAATWRRPHPRRRPPVRENLWGWVLCAVGAERAQTPEPRASPPRRQRQSSEHVAACVSCGNMSRYRTGLLRTLRRPMYSPWLNSARTLRHWPPAYTTAVPSRILPFLNSARGETCGAWLALRRTAGLFDGRSHGAPPLNGTPRTRCNRSHGTHAMHWPSSPIGAPVQSMRLLRTTGLRRIARRRAVATAALVAASALLTSALRLNRRATPPPPYAAPPRRPTPSAPPSPPPPPLPRRPAPPPPQQPPSASARAASDAASAAYPPPPPLPMLPRVP